MAKKITFEVPDDFDPENFQPPEGWKIVLPGKGGRPRADLKRIAVALARHWRMDRYSEAPSRSIAWICEHWQHHGVHDEARARERVKEAIPLLNHSMMFILPGGGWCVKLPIQNGSRSWIWHHGLHEAIELESVNCKMTIQYNDPHPIAAAVSSACKSPRRF